MSKVSVRQKFKRLREYCAFLLRRMYWVINNFEVVFIQNDIIIQTYSRLLMETTSASKKKVYILFWRIRQTLIYVYMFPFLILSIFKYKYVQM